MSTAVRGVIASMLFALACGSSSGTPDGGTGCMPKVPTDDSVPGTLADWCQVQLTNGDVAQLASDVVPFTLTTPLYSEWKAAGAWNFMSYRWNDAGTEALPLPGGEVVSFTYVDGDGATQNPHYLVPSTQQCIQCHAEPGTIAPIGPKAHWLNTDYAYTSGTENQLAHWTRIGILSGAPDPASAPRLTVASDPDSGTTETRARAYLEANCGFCHNPNGNAPYDIVPGHPENSVITYRIEATSPAAAMPQIGRSVVDTHGVALVNQWITDMTGTCN